MIIILIILMVIIVFFWPFINHPDLNLLDTIKQGFPSMQVISGTTNPGGKSDTTTEYNDEYLRWAGQVKAGQYAVWSKITIEPPVSEIPVGTPAGPRPPCIIYGNIHETTGNGINLMILDEANYNSWRNGNKDISTFTTKNDITDTDYIIDISHGNYYIVLDNRKNTNDSFIGFTGVQAYVRPITQNESLSANHQYPSLRWEIKNEKLTIFEYILKLLKPKNTIPQTPPSIHN